MCLIKEKWERVGRTGKNVGKSATDETVWVCCQNGARKGSGRLGNVIAGPREPHRAVTVYSASHQVQIMPQQGRQP